MGSSAARGSFTMGALGFCFEENKGGRRRGGGVRTTGALFSLPDRSSRDLANSAALTWRFFNKETVVSDLDIKSIIDACWVSFKDFKAIFSSAIRIVINRCLDKSSSASSLLLGGVRCGKVDTPIVSILGGGRGGITGSVFVLMVFLGFSLGIFLANDDARISDAIYFFSVSSNFSINLTAVADATPNWSSSATLNISLSNPVNEPCLESGSVDEPCLVSGNGAGGIVSMGRVVVADD